MGSDLSPHQKPYILPWQSLPNTIYCGVYILSANYRLSLCTTTPSCTFGRSVKSVMLMLQGSCQGMATDSCQIKYWYYILFTQGSSTCLLFKKVLLHLNNRKQDPVKQKPDQDVHQIEDKRIPAEEEPDSPWCTGTYYDTLRQRLQQNCIRHHGYPQFRPSTNKDVQTETRKIHDTQRNTISAYTSNKHCFISFQHASNDTAHRQGDIYRSTNGASKFK